MTMEFKNADRKKTAHNLYCAPMLTKEECNEIIKNSNKWLEGTVLKFGQFIKVKEYRSVQICRTSVTEELVDKIFVTVFKVNTATFRFHLDGYDERDVPNVLKYSADRGDHYVWHTDLIPGDAVRKLSFTIQLSDPSEYDGGDLEFSPGTTDPNIRKQGMMTIFPSYATHRVTPVTRGTRYAIVGWIYGPEFR